MWPLSIHLEALFLRSYSKALFPGGDICKPCKQGKSFLSVCILYAINIEIQKQMYLSEFINFFPRAKKML
jgi:hypothetical protein